MSKVIKAMEIDDLKRTFQDVRDMVVLTTDRLDSLGEYTLRANLRKKKIRLKVVKNSLCRNVFKELNISVPDNSAVWSKQSVVAWGGSSIAELSREIERELKNPKLAGLYRDKAKGTERVSVKGAVADGQAVTFAQALKMPTRQEVIAEILGMILSPGSQLAACLMGPASQIASQLKTLGEPKEETKEEPAPAA
jgi:large subunit ribosomal protein L10